MITISSNAKGRLSQVLSGGSCLLISVIPGGCNGFSYKYTIENAPPQDATEVSSNPKVMVANSAKSLLDGGCLEFQADELGTAFFSIVNPNATSKCGCGNSFSTF